MAHASTSSPPASPPQPSGSTGAPMQYPKLVSFRRGSSPSRPYVETINEQSPLIRPRESSEIDGVYGVVSRLGSEGWQGDADESTKSSWYLFLLTLGGLGLQIGWSVETSNGSPYLLSLGLSKSLLALVWIAGPLSGVLVQPYVGMKSDNCRMRWGKRRPFIVGGAIATVVSLMILAWAREIVVGFLGIFGVDKDSVGVKNTTISFAVLFVYVLDFAINVIQAGIRAFMVDCTPTHQQETANAWMIRMSGIGNILGYLAGNVNLPDYLPWLGGSQFKVLCAIASFIMAVTVAISCSTIQERDPRFDGPAEAQDGIFAFFKSLYRSIRKLPPQIRKVCEVQFFAWIGWFPFLFYITTYVGEIYVDPYLEAKPNMSDEDVDKLWEEATRIGTRALLIFAITTFVASVFLPFIIPPTYEAPKERPATPMTPLTPATTGSASGAGGYFALNKPNVLQHRSILDRISSYLDVLQISGLTLRRSWILSHVMFAALCSLTFFVRTTLSATFLVALIGIPWTLTNWAPFALISSEISKRDAIRRGLLKPSSRDAALVAAGEDEASSEGADQAGVVLGIHNVAIAAPQVIATIVSSIIFKMLQKGRNEPGDNSVAWVLRFGGCCAVVAAWFALGIKEEKEDPDLPVRRRRDS